MADKRQTVLIVDDNPRMIHILGEALRGRFRVLMALNGERALKRAASEPAPDLILLDIVMPGMDGMTVCKKLKENPATKEIPVIFITGESREHDEERGLALGAVDYLTKPCSPAILLARVLAHLALRQTRLDLEAANHELEERVRRRTRQLEKINENLTLEITERTRAEKELRQLRNLLSNIINSMPSILVGVNREGKITTWNLEAENRTGIPADQAVGGDLVDALPGLADRMDSVFRAIRRREAMREEKVSLESEGERRYSDITVYPLVADGAEGAVIRVDDVTERVRMEEVMIQ
ncbi:MAG: response regulator, partial [Desulfobacterales bacterium]|nr:response regulator [Desulfobacterales bacterium]